MRRALIAAVAVLAAAIAASSVSAAPGMKIGFYDEALTLEYPDAYGFNQLRTLKAQVLRMNLYWNQVARSRPADPANPDDPAYDWTRYDVALQRASSRNIEVLLSIFGTPGWANGGKSREYAPLDAADLQAFATAAATRYSGGAHPRVRLWLAWNEPNAPNFLKPQSVNEGGGWTFTSPELYAPICNAVVDGVNAADPSNTIACGAFNPRGKTRANGNRDAVSPVLFLQRMATAGARPEVIAHHPYPWAKTITPTTRISSKTAVSLSNLNVLVQAIDGTYGKGMRLWLTEYGYQTNPPDRLFGVPWVTQAKYLTQAFGIARRHPRVDLMLWFQLKDEPRVGGWQSGVINTKNVKKPSYKAFQKLR
jgi:hypothetical protein